MAYDGDVAVGEPAQCLETEQLVIHKLAVGPLSNNVYLLVDKATGSTLLIDAADDPNAVLDLCGDELDQVLTTHGHWDHVQALAQVAEATGATTLASAGDTPLLPVAVDRQVADGESIWVGDTELKAVTLLGHGSEHDERPMESLALIHEDRDGSVHIFTGDCLFPGGIGKTAGRESFDRLFGEVKAKIFDAYSDEAHFYPGHGADSTLGAERPQLDEWASRGW